MIIYQCDENLSMWWNCITVMIIYKCDENLWLWWCWKFITMMMMKIYHCGKRVSLWWHFIAMRKVYHCDEKLSLWWKSNAVMKRGHSRKSWRMQGLFFKKKFLKFYWHNIFICWIECVIIEGYKLALHGYYENFNGQNKSRLLWKPDISFTALRRKSIRCVKWSLYSLLVVLDGKWPGLLVVLHGNGPELLVAVA